VGSMLWMGPSNMWVGTDKSVIVLDATVCLNKLIQNNNNVKEKYSRNPDLTS
jgi:hypothetical protein